MKMRMKVRTMTQRGLAFETLMAKAKRHQAQKAVQVGVRVPGNLMATIDAMAKVAKVKRSDIVRLLLAAAVAEGVAQTTDEWLVALRKAGAWLDSDSGRQV
jgi:hypothetical protein